MRLTSIERFREAMSNGCWLVIVDKANGMKLHRPPCGSVKESYFKQKVIDGVGKNGSYHAFATRSEALEGIVGVLTPCRCVAMNGDGAGFQVARSRGTEPSTGAPAGTDVDFKVDGHGPKGPVRIGSPFAVPFEPKGPAVRLRTRIRERVALLEARDGEILRGVLHADPNVLPASVDAENVLFYNIGAASFAAARRAGLMWEAASPGTKPAGFDDPVIVEYSVVPAASDFEYWRRGNPVAEFRTVAIPVLGADSKAATVWRAIHDAPDAEFGVGGVLDGDFGLDLVLHLPASSGTSVLSVVKPLVDGLISALHAHDGSDLAELIRRLAASLSEPESRISSWLGSQRHAALGSRRLLWRRAHGVQWNPADDRCRAARIRVVRDETPAWRVSGTLFPVSAWDVLEGPPS